MISAIMVTRQIRRIDKQNDAKIVHNSQSVNNLAFFRITLNNFNTYIKYDLNLNSIHLS